MKTYRQLHRWHIWLGWLVGVPLIAWTASGLFMILKPIEEVRGEQLRAAPAAIVPAAALPAIDPASGPVTSLRLVAATGGSRWIVEQGDATARYDPRTGAKLPSVDEAEARAIVARTIVPDLSVTRMTRFAAADAPGDFRRPRPAWQARLSDGTHAYIDADSGELLAVRTPFWRAYDFMWGLHIMDLDTREDFNNPVLKIFAALALLSLLLAFPMLILRQRRLTRNRAP
jgi:hypothetical protein